MLCGLLEGFPQQKKTLTSSIYGANRSHGFRRSALPWTASIPYLRKTNQPTRAPTGL